MAQFFAFCDPADGDDQGMHDPIGAARQYYSAFLLLVGQRKFSRELFASTLCIGAIERSTALTQIGNVSYFVFNMHRMYNLFTPLLAKKKDVSPRRLPNEWLVRVDIIKAIIDNDSESLSLIMIDISAELNSTEIQDETMYFRDGTRCRRRS